MGKAAQSFEDLHIYQQSSELVNSIYAATRNGAFARDFGLANQVRRAGVSIISNIAEGFERGSKTEFIQFLYIAKGSCGEVRAQLQVARDQQYIPKLEYERLGNQCRQISAMISNFIGHLQHSDYQGGKANRTRRIAEAGKKIEKCEKWEEGSIML